MKRPKNCMVIKLGLFLLLLSSPNSRADTDTQTLGTLNFNITIIEFSCTVSSDDIAVDMGHWGTYALNKSGNVTSAVPFTISLNDCTSSGDISITFTGTSDNSNSEFLALSSDSTSEGAAIEILNSDGSRLALNKESPSVSVDEGGSALFSFKARYVATQSGVTSGTANGVATFLITYE